MNTGDNGLGSIRGDLSLRTDFVEPILYIERYFTQHRLGGGGGLWLDSASVR